MTRYSVQLIDGIAVKGYGYLSFIRNMGKNIGKKISKNLKGVNTVRNFLIIFKNVLQMHLKLLQIEQFKKQQKQLVI